MTEEAVRTIFFKNFLGGNLNEELLSCKYEIFQSVIQELTCEQDRPEEILGMINRAHCLAIIFASIDRETIYLVPIDYLEYIDELREKLVKISDYLHTNYDSTDPLFKEKFTQKNIIEIEYEIYSKIQSEKMDNNIRSFNSMEIQAYLEFLNIALVAIFGEDMFRKIIKELNKCMAVLRLCQYEAKKLEQLDPSKCKPS
ncbi:MAG: hypothetical protein AAB461_02560 [Patescibacteria group bacterium]